MRRWCILLICLLLACSSSSRGQQLITSEPTNSFTATPTLWGVTAENGLQLEIERFELQENGYLILFATLHNGSNRRQCIYARDVQLILDGEEYEPDDRAMSAVQDNLEPYRDYIGPFIGHCVDRNSTIATFAVFNVPMTAETAELRVNNNSLELEVTWVSAAVVVAPTETEPFTLVPTTLAPPTTAPALLLLSTNTLAGIFTPTATITDTAAPTNTLRPTTIPEPTATRRPVVTSAPVVTMYARSTANLRTCANTDNNQCPAVTQVSGGAVLQVVGQVNGVDVGGSTQWYIVLHEGEELYIHSSLVQSSPPAVANTPVQNQQLVSTPIPAPSGGQQWICTGDRYNCPDFNSCADITSYWNACPGDPSDLDGDDNGTYCVSRCG
jgi:hypothetical protein